MKADELIKNNALQNIEVSGKQKVVFEEIALAAVSMARMEEKEKAIDTLNRVLYNWINGIDAKCILEEFKEELEANK